MKRREFISLLGGAAAAWPLAARAQQPKAMPVVGFLHPASPESYAPYVEAFRQALKGNGFVEGGNLAIEFRWGEDHIDRLPALAADLVRRGASVIVAGGMPAAIAAKAATSSIPIVFSVGSDPVEFGLVASFNQPGGNVTGTVQFNDSLVAKRLELLHELVPKTAMIAVPIELSTQVREKRLASVQAAARELGLQIRAFDVTSGEQFDAMFETLVRERIGALVVPNGTVFTNGRERLVALAARYAVPAIYEFREFTAAGGLISYGSSNSYSYQQVGIYVARILKGEKPGDLPIVQPTKFELVINLKTAKALGLTISESFLLRADEVIE
jgi:putative tryptophan/tyrosine transport system substrate-binding protein